MKELSLKPYTGRLYFADTRKKYEAWHKKIFGNADPLNITQAGRFAGGGDSEGRVSYLVWGQDTSSIVHELSHVVLDVFERSGIDPRGCNGEPFCYLLGQLVTEARV